MFCFFLFIFILVHILKSCMDKLISYLTKRDLKYMKALLTYLLYEQVAPSLFIAQ